MRPFEILMCGYANDLELNHGGPNAGIGSDFVLMCNCTGGPGTLVPPYSFISDTVQRLQVPYSVNADSCAVVQ